jgi:hypothetical protein
LREKHPDWDWDYWEAQMEGYDEVFKRPTWRDFLDTQREKLDKVHNFFWENPDA